MHRLARGHASNGTVCPTPRSADDTRRAILDAAEQRLAAEGIMAATFADIIDDAGQRNNSAIQYHFGDRIGLLEAITERRAQQMATHRDGLVAALPAHPTLDEVIEVVVHPLSELLRDPGGADGLSDFVAMAHTVYGHGGARPGEPGGSWWYG